jgi:GxxExxY protein
MRVDEQDPLTGIIIGCAIEVHRELGPGLLESAYQQCLAHELHLEGIPFTMEQTMPVEYKGLHLDCGYRLDFLVDQQVVLELKAVDAVTDVHRAQVLTYLKLAKVRRGLLLNFHTMRLVDGIERFIL